MWFMGEMMGYWGTTRAISAVALLLVFRTDVTERFESLMNVSIRLCHYVRIIGLPSCDIWRCVN